MGKLNNVLRWILGLLVFGPMIFLFVVSAVAVSIIEPLQRRRELRSLGVRPVHWRARLGMAVSMALCVWFLPEFWVWALPWRSNSDSFLWFGRAVLLVGAGIPTLFALLLGVESREGLRSGR
jgi:hypothetical protein